MAGMLNPRLSGRFPLHSAHFPAAGCLVVFMRERQEMLLPTSVPWSFVGLSW